MPKVKIQQPRKRATPTKVTRKFIASGVVWGKKTRSVKGEFKLASDGSAVGMVRLVSFKPVSQKGKPNRFLYRWVMFINASTATLDQEYDLTVTPVKQDGNTHAPGADTVKVKLVASRTVQASTGSVVGTTGYIPPIVQSPPEQYEIAGSERDVFFAFGDSNLPITSVTIGGRPADYTQWLDNPDYFWWAEFYSLGTDPGEGAYDILVLNADGVEVTEVTIESA